MKWLKWLCAALLVACQPASVSFLNSNITGAQLHTSVALHSTDGASLHLNAANLQPVTAVFFGFTMCPDVCPTTLGHLKIVKQQLGADADKLRVILVSLDPERDSMAVLQQYTAAFASGFIGAATDLPNTQRMAQDLGISFEKIGSGEFYMLKHSANLYLIDAQGRFRVSIPYGTPPDSIAHDVRQLMSERR
ncbi:MAG: SCO family protein [Formosimonas sp.]